MNLVLPKLHEYIGEREELTRRKRRRRRRKVRDRWPATKTGLLGRKLLP